MTNLLLKIWRGVLSTCVLLFALTGCKGQPMVPAAETYFEGQQLRLAKLVDQADAEAVYQMAMSMSLDELNFFGKANMTVLAYAMRKPPAETKWYPVMTALIKAGADPLIGTGSAKASFMQFAMGEAYGSKNLKLLQAALDAGINPDTDSTYETSGPLISDIADQDGLGAIQLLVEYGADVNRRDAVGRTALLSSISTLGLEEIVYLLDRGASPKVVDYYGVSFPHKLNLAIQGLQARKDPRLSQLLAIRDRIVKMNVAWPPETPEQFQERMKAEYKKKTGKDYIFIPDEGYKAFVPTYAPAPVRKVPLQR